jgi:hypothetical protein
LEAKAVAERLLAAPDVSATDTVRARVWHTAGQILTRSARSATAYAALNALVREIAKAAKLNHKLWTPHLLRHGFATRMNRDGAPLFTIQRALGHRNVATTQKYVQPTVEDVKVWMRPLPATPEPVALPELPAPTVTMAPTLPTLPPKVLEPEVMYGPEERPRVLEPEVMYGPEERPRVLEPEVMYGPELEPKPKRKRKTPVEVTAEEAEPAPKPGYTIRRKGEPKPEAKLLPLPRLPKDDEE